MASSWQPDLDASELVNLRAALREPLDVRLAYLRSRYVGGPVHDQGTLEGVALVRKLRASLFDGLAWDLKEKTVNVFSDDHRPGI
jgi:hypothetical protein